MTEIDDYSQIATDQVENLVWEEVTDQSGEVTSLLEINSELYIYEITLNCEEYGRFNCYDFPFVMRRYDLGGAKVLDTRHHRSQEAAMAQAAAWERIAIRAKKKVENEICLTPSPQYL